MLTLLAIRAQIAKDIVALDRYQPVMLENVVVEIDRLSKLLKPESSDVVPDESTKTLLETDGRNSVLNRVKESINKAVVVRSYDEKLAKRISGDTANVRYALFQLKLEGLKLLALKQEQAAYDAQLNQIIDQFENEETERLNFAIMESFNGLQAINLTAEVPTILSPDLLNSALAEQNGAAQ